MKQEFLQYKCESFKKDPMCIYPIPGSQIYKKPFRSLHRFMFMCVAYLKSSQYSRKLNANGFICFNTIDGVFFFDSSSS